MTLSNAQATFGLTAIATLAAYGTSGSVKLGPSNRTLRLDQATKGYRMLAIFAAPGNTFALSLFDNVAAGMTPWVGGNAQEEVSTAAGTITTAGNATVTVTSSGMAGSPLAVTFAVALNDTATQWAQKAREALAANAVIAARFTVFGTTTAIGLRRKPLRTLTAPDGDFPIFASNDGSLNIATADATSAGITESTGSANTTLATPTAGVRTYNSDGVDLDGNAVSLTTIYGYQVALDSSANAILEGDTVEHVAIGGGETLTRASDQGLVLEPIHEFTAGGPSALSITVLGA